MAVGKGLGRGCVRESCTVFLNGGVGGCSKGWKQEGVL